MTKELLSEKICKRICDHMNLDHSNSVKALIEYYGGLKNVIDAKMTSLNSKSMSFKTDEGEIIEIAFNHELQDSSDAHKTLVSMIKSIPEDISGS